MVKLFAYSIRVNDDDGDDCDAADWWYYNYRKFSALNFR